MVDQPALRTPAAGALPDVEVLKALGDDTRYRIFCAVAAAESPCSTTTVADALGLHVNTVRPHLERMRVVGLLDVRLDDRGGVGRPQHLFAVSPSAPVPASDPSMPRLASGILAAAATAGVAVDDVVAAGRAQGERDAAAGGVDDAGSCVDALCAAQAAQGFHPTATTADDGAVVVAFGRCPFEDLLPDHGSLVCGLHRGQVEGFVTACDDPRSVRFRAGGGAEPCHAALVR